MTEKNQAVFDRYFEIADRSALENLDLDKEYSSIFAPDATVVFEGVFEPVTGLPAIAEFYRKWFSQWTEGKHVWTITELEDGTLKAQFVAVARTAEGQPSVAEGVEYATFDADGLITLLRVTDGKS